MTGNMLINKYSKMYKTIISKAKAENRQKIINGEYYEFHHVLPESIYPKFKNLIRYPWNGVLLTAREHFLCHWLLTKCYSNTQYASKMAWAFHRMAFSKTNKTQRNLSSAQYEIARIAHANNMKLFHPSKNDPKWSEKASERTRKSWERDHERREEMSKRSQKYYHDNEEKLLPLLLERAKKGGKIRGDQLRGKKFPGTGLAKEKNVSAKHYTIFDSAGTQTECYGTIRDYAFERGISPDSLIGAIKMGKQHKGYSGIDHGFINNRKEKNKIQEKYECPHCDVFSVKGNFLRWHGDKCKMNPLNRKGESVNG